MAHRRRELVPRIGQMARNGSTLGIDPDDDTSRLRRLPYRRDEGDDAMSARLGPPNLSDLVPASASNQLRLHLEPTGSSVDLLNGAWWPHSTDASVELPGLVLAIDGIHGEVIAIRLGADGWRQGPPEVRVGRRVIGVAYFASQPASLMTALYAHGDHINLLVVAPKTAEIDAGTAMVWAASTGNRMTSAHHVPIRARSRIADGRWALDRREAGRRHP